MRYSRNRCVYAEYSLKEKKSFWGYDVTQSSWPIFCLPFFTVGYIEITENTMETTIVSIWGYIGIMYSV